MSIVKSSTQLKRLLEGESQIQTTLSSLTPGLRVEDAAHCYASSSDMGGGFGTAQPKQPSKAHPHLDVFMRF